MTIDFNTPLSVVFIFIGSIFLIFSAIKSLRIIKELPDNTYKKNWRILFYLIGFFITSYYLLIILIMNIGSNGKDILYAMIMLVESIFIFYVTYVSYLTLEKFRRIEFLEKEIVKDKLMGIYNQKYFLGRLDEEFMKYKNHKIPFSILLLEINQFKDMNETFGRKASDKFLIHFAKFIAKNIRPSDIFARYVGVEMAIILPNTDFVEAEILARKLCTITGNKNFDIDMTDEINPLFMNCTINIGLASSANKFNTVNDILGLTSEALCRARNEGGNVTVTYT